MSIDLTLATYNIHHGQGLDGRLGIPRIASLLKDTECDVACLQEVDCRVPRSRRAHQPRELATALCMKAVYGPTIRWPFGARYGNLLLSRLPLSTVRLHRLPGGDEQRGIVEAHLQTPSGPVAVFCTHWGLSKDERVRQAEATVEAMKHAELPALLAGDLNETADGAAHTVLLESGLLHLGPDEPTYPADDPVDRIDHVYGSPGWRAIEAYTIPSLASDHRPVVVEVRFDG
jgi:endonuclease/exonuclease/phosphatase family metal-dependent hydrolase